MTRVPLYKTRRIAVAMSGGVDSSVAAYLLQQNPCHSLLGLFMSNWSTHDDDDDDSHNNKNNKNNNNHRRHCHEVDYHDAQRTCEHLGLPPLQYASFAKEYWTHVFEPFVSTIAGGHATPNPDCDCNAHIKFGAMKEYAQDKLGVDWIATGHYARLYHRNNHDQQPLPEGFEDWMLETTHPHDFDTNDNDDDVAPLLLSGVDESKDQSYFLATVNGKAFRNVIFPLGHLYKSKNANNTIKTPTVRQLAHQANLPTASKRESMGICFVGKRNFSQFISQYLPQQPPRGHFINVENGSILGDHKGSWHYTIGQGAKISGADQKWFVVQQTKDAVVVCPGTHHASLFANQVTLQSMHWIGGCIPPPLLKEGYLRIACRPRHLQPKMTGTLQWNHHSNTYTIDFDGPVRALTPGQIAVLYIGSVCLGGGHILSSGPSYHEMGLELPKTLHPSGHNDLSVLKQDIQQVQSRSLGYQT